MAQVILYQLLMHNNGDGMLLLSQNTISIGSFARQ